METGAVQSGQDREGSDVPLSLDPPLPSGRETSSRKAAVEDTSEGGCETGWRTIWSRGQSTRMGICFARGVRCCFGEALARDVFVFLGFSSGPGVPAAVGSLLGHQCLALPLCPGSLQRRGAPRQHPSKSLSLSRPCARPRACQVPQQLLVALSLWERPFQAVGQPRGPLLFSAAYVLTKYF